MCVVVVCCGGCHGSICRCFFVVVALVLPLPLLCHFLFDLFALVALHASCGTVYYNRSCLFVSEWLGVCVCVGGSVTTIARNYVH